MRLEDGGCSDGHQRDLVTKLKVTRVAYSSQRELSFFLSSVIEWLFAIVGCLFIYFYLMRKLI